MNKFKCILLVFLLISNCHLFGDVIISKRYPPALILATIDNLDEYPDITVVGVSECFAVPLTSERDAYIVKPDSCLELFNSCNAVFYAVKKDYLEKKELKKIKWNKDRKVKVSNLSLRSKYLRPNQPISTVENHYRIAGFNSEKMIIYKSLEVLKYSDGRADKVTEFKYEGDLSELRKTF